MVDILLRSRCGTVWSSVTVVHPVATCAVCALLGRTHTATLRTEMSAWEASATNLVLVVSETAPRGADLPSLALARPLRTTAGPRGPFRNKRSAHASDERAVDGWILWRTETRREIDCATLHTQREKEHIVR